jgi:hypothetical protein
VTRGWAWRKQWAVPRPVFVFQTVTWSASDRNGVTSIRNLALGWRRMVSFVSRTLQVQPLYFPGVNRASNRKSYQELSWRVKRGQRVRLITSPPSVSRLYRRRWNIKVHLRHIAGLSLLLLSLFQHFGSLISSKVHIVLDKSEKVKLSRNRPRGPIGLWDVKDPTLSGQSAHRWR